MPERSGTDALDRLDPNWDIWTDETNGQLTLTFRPDVFEGATFPAACLPTIVLTSRHPDANPRSEPDGGWHVLLYLEPDVRVRDHESSVDSRTEGVEAAVELADAFASGDVEYRTAYSVPREDYLDRLDELTGRQGT